MISLDEFLTLPVDDVARLLKQAGPEVCVFPINGTRRWFMLEYGEQDWADPVQAFMDFSSRNHIGLYRLFFEHGISTLVTPVIGEEILTRGESYMARIGAEGYARLASGEDFLGFYDEFDVRVRFYGNFRQALSSTPYAHLIEQFDSIAARTENHKSCRLLLGAFADNSYESIGRMAIEHFQKTGLVPDHHRLVESYYGEYIEPASIFIGFDKFSVFDYPLLATGAEDIYFTVAPSPYMTATQLRKILYDHLYTRRVPEVNYQDLSAASRKRLHDFYTDQKDMVMGTGTLLENIWLPEIGTDAERNHHDR